MQILRIGSPDLDAIRAAYRWPDLEDDNPTKQCSKSMLALLDVLETLATETTKWGITSHSTLSIFPRDSHDAGAQLAIRPWPDYYDVAYLIPESDAPWPHACVIGSTEAVATAAQMVVDGLNCCEPNPSISGPSLWIRSW